MWLDLLQPGPFGVPVHEVRLIDLQPPGHQGLEHVGPGAGITGHHQVRADGTVWTFVLGVELPLQLVKGLQETHQWPLEDKQVKHCKHVHRQRDGEGETEK